MAYGHGLSTAITVVILNSPNGAQAENKGDLAPVVRAQLICADDLRHSRPTRSGTDFPKRRQRPLQHDASRIERT